MKIIIQQETFDPQLEQNRYAATLDSKRIGATVAFTGTMRDFNEGSTVDSLFIEHYPGMTEKQIEKICLQAQQKWRLIDILIIHRVGTLQAGEPIVLICIWSEHRADAFNACRHLINELKSNAPFWKSESTSSGKNWVENNTTDEIK